MKPVSEVKFQTVTMDTGMTEVLYEGMSLADAGKAALEYSGKCGIHEYRDNGTVRPVAEYENGQATKGYVFD